MNTLKLIDYSYKTYLIFIIILDFELKPFI